MAMNRRNFLKSFSAGAVASVIPSWLSGCAHAPVRPDGSAEPRPVESLLKDGARTMWCAPHPDDECFSGTLLARSSIYYRNPLFFLILTHGDGGQCCLPEGCHPDLATVRGREMAQVAERYHAELQHEHFFNAPLPVESFPLRHEIYAKWCAQGDPQGLVVTAIRRFKPDLLVTFHPDFGATGHPEHQLAARLATTGARLAADPNVEAGGLPPHRVTRLYWVLNRFWLLRMFGRCDPGPVTEVWDAHARCTEEMNCRDFMVEATRLHRTQDADMSMVRRMQAAFGTMYLRQVDYHAVSKPPDEVATERTI